MFIRELYGTDDATWWRNLHAHWIAERPEEEFTPEVLFTSPHVRYGEPPTFPDIRNG